MPKHKLFNVRSPYSYKAVGKDLDLHRDLIAERERTGKLLMGIRDVVVEFKTITASYELLRENELLNNELEAMLQQYKQVDR